MTQFKAHEKQGKIRRTINKAKEIDPAKAFEENIAAFRKSRNKPPGESVVDFRGLLAALKETDYNGSVTLDHVNPGADDEALFRESAVFIRRILNELNS